MTGGATSCGDVVRSVLRNTCDNTQHKIDFVEVFLDFEHSIPSESERLLFEHSEQLLARAEQVLRDVEQYGKGATDEVRYTLQNPDDQQAFERAERIVRIMVARIHSYYNLSLQIEQLLPQLLWELCAGPLPPEEQLDSKQALVRQLARLIDFVLAFDSAKTCTPALQNDFSYHRRQLMRSSEQTSTAVGEANAVSLFLAAPTPLLRALSAAAITFVKAHPALPVGNTTDTLAAVASVCRYMASTGGERISPETRLLTVRVMVGAVILFDHVDAGGAFTRDAPIDVRGVVEAVREHTQQPQTDVLLNALRYTTKHLNESTTPKSIRALLA